MKTILFQGDSITDAGRSREDFSEQVLKRCSTDEDIFDDQLTLKLTRRRKKKDSAGEDPALTE